MLLLLRRSSARKKSKALAPPAAPAAAVVAAACHSAFHWTKPSLTDGKYCSSVQVWQGVKVSGTARTRNRTIVVLSAPPPRTPVERPLSLSLSLSLFLCVSSVLPSRCTRTYDAREPRFSLPRRTTVRSFVLHLPCCESRWMRELAGAAWSGLDPRQVGICTLARNTGERGWRVGGRRRVLLHYFFFGKDRYSEV